MALSDKSKRYLKYILLNQDVTDELITSIEQRSDADISADAELFAAIETEKTARINADGILHAKISTETAARQGGVAAEATARRQADDDLDARLDIVEGDDVTNGSIAKSLKDAKQYADNVALAEENRAQAAETALGIRIDNILRNTDPIALDSLSEVVEAFENADYNLQNTLTTLANNATSNLNNETAARISADESIDDRLDVIQGADTVTGSIEKALKDAKDYTDAEKSERIAALLEEENRRIAAYESEMEARMTADEIETNTRIEEDNSIRAAVSAERLSRIAEDSSLQSALDNEIFNRENAILNERSERSAADQSLQAAINAEISARTSSSGILSMLIDEVEMSVKSE